MIFNQNNSKEAQEEAKLIKIYQAFGWKHFKTSKRIKFTINDVIANIASEQRALINHIKQL